MADEITIVVRAEDQFSGVLSNFGNIITGIKSAIDLIGQAFDAAAGLITPFINSASESEQAVARLEGILRATGGAAGVTSQDMQNLASQLQGVTRFSDETILAGTALLLTFRNISGDTLERTIPAMLDMAEIFGSVDSAAMQLGKALNEPATMLGALSRAGVTFSTEQKEMIKNFVEMGDVASAQNIILTEVEKQVGSLSEAMGMTFAGQVEIAKNKLDEIRETIGNAVLPVLTDLLIRLSEFVSQPEVIEFFQDLAASISEFATNLDLGDKLSNFLDQIMTAMQTGDWSAVWDSIKQAFADAWNFIWPVIDELFARLFNWMESKVQEWIDGGGADRLSNSIIDALNTTFMAPEFQSKAALAFETLFNIFIDAIGLIKWNEIWSTIGGNISDALDLRNFFRIDEIQDAWKQIGIDIIKGLSLGLSIDNMKYNILTFINNVIDYFKQILGISSPSTVFMQIGVNIVAGLVAGLTAATAWLINTVENIIEMILAPFIPILNLLGIDTSGLTGGSTGTVGTAGTVTSDSGLGAGLGQPVTNNYYGPVYFMGAGEPGSYYDCPSPNPLMQATSGSLTTSAI